MLIVKFNKKIALFVQCTAISLLSSILPMGRCHVPIEVFGEIYKTI